MASYFVAVRRKIANPFSCNILAAKRGKEEQLFLQAHPVPVIQRGISRLQADAQHTCWFYDSEEDDLRVDPFNYFRVQWVYGCPLWCPQQLECGWGICSCLRMWQTPEVGILTKPWIASSLKFDSSLKNKKGRDTGKTVWETSYGKNLGAVLISTASNTDEDGLITVIGVRLMCHLMKQ